MTFLSFIPCKHFLHGAAVNISAAADIASDIITVHITACFDRRAYTVAIHISACAYASVYCIAVYIAFGINIAGNYAARNIAAA